MRQAGLERRAREQLLGAGLTASSPTLPCEIITLGQEDPS